MNSWYVILYCQHKLIEVTRHSITPIYQKISFHLLVILIDWLFKKQIGIVFTYQ